MKPEDRAVYESYMEAVRTKASLIAGNYRFGEITGKMEGIAIGREEGRLEGLHEAIQRLVASGMSEAEARRRLGL